MDNNINRFVSKLFNPGEWIEIRCIGNNKDTKSFWVQVQKDILQSLQNIIVNNNKEYNIYFGVQPREKDKRPPIRTNCFFIDVDYKGIKDYLSHISQIEKDWEKMGISPTVKVNSGHGIHYYWCLSQNTTVTNEQFTAIEEALIDLFKGDKPVKDRARILRLPGSKNIKDINDIKECFVEWINDNTYTTSNFSELLEKHNEYLAVIKKDDECNREWKNCKNDDRQQYINVVLGILELYGKSMFSEYSEFLRFCYACKSEDIQYERIDKILQQSSGYDYDGNLKIYNELSPNGKINFGTAYYFATIANEKELKRKLAKINPNTNTRNTQSLKISSAADLAKKEFQPIKYIIPGILVEGLTVIGGKPKIGKSWLAMSIALATATGGQALGEITCAKNDVLYISLEDNERRVQTRITTIRDSFPKNLYFTTEMQSLAEGGAEQLEITLNKNPNIKLVIIDTFQRIKGTSSKKGCNAYEYDYSLAAKLQSIAINRNMSIICIHHLKKAKEEDYVEQLSGSMGLPAAADSIWVLKRFRNENEAILSITGRDIEEKELGLMFNEDCSWTLIGDSEFLSLSKERREIVKLLKDGISRKVKDIAVMLNKDFNSVNKLIWSMLRDDIVIKDSNKRITLHKSNVKSLKQEERGGAPPPPSYIHRESYVNNVGNTSNVGNVDNVLNLGSISRSYIMKIGNRESAPPPSNITDITNKNNFTISLSDNWKNILEDKK